MKKILLTNILLCAVFFLQAQTIIKDPETGMTNAGYLKITQIEINDEETVLSFYVEPWAGRFGIAAKSYIQAVGQRDTLFMTWEDAPFPENNGYISVPSDGISYKLYFPPISPKVSRIDFGEVSPNGWYIFDIEIGKQNHHSMVPEKFLGNWFSEDKKLWEIGLYDSVAVYNMNAWNYKNVSHKDELLKLELVNETGEETIYARKGDGQVCWFGTSVNNMKKYSNQTPGLPDMDFSVYDNPETTDVAPDKAVYYGFIDKFTPRAGKFLGTVRVTNILTGSPEIHTAQINRYGVFSVEFPLKYAQEISIDFPGRRDRLFIEPGKKLFQFISSTLDWPSNLFMGKSAALNYGLLTTRRLETSQNDFLKQIVDMSVDDYLVYIQDIKTSKLKELEEIREINKVSEKSYKIRKMNIEFESAQNAFRYLSNLQTSKLMDNRNKGSYAPLTLTLRELDYNELEFLKKTPVNDKMALFCTQYYSLISALNYSDLTRERISIYNIQKKLKTILNEKNVAIEAKEKEMLNYVETYMEGQPGTEIVKEFSEKYSEIYRDFNSKNSEELQKIRNELYATNLKNNLKQIFGVSDGLPFEVIKLQNYFSSIRNADSEKLTKEYIGVKESINTSILKEMVMADYYTRKAKLEIIESSDGGVYLNEADKFFDSLIKKFRGKVVYVDFWATWCAPCRDGIERIKPLKEELANEDIVFVYITNQTSDPKEYKKMMPDIKGEHFKVSSEEWNLLTSKFNIVGIPHYVLVDKKGKIVNDHMMHLSNEPLKKLLLETTEK